MQQESQANACEEAKAAVAALAVDLLYCLKIIGTWINFLQVCLDAIERHYYCRINHSHNC